MQGRNLWVGFVLLSAMLACSVRSAEAEARTVPGPFKIIPVAVSPNYARQIALVAREFNLVVIDGIYGPTQAPSIRTRGQIIRVMIDEGLIPATTAGAAEAVTNTTRTRILFVLNNLGLIGTEESIKPGDLQPGTVANAQILDGAVSTTKLADGSVTNPKLADKSVTTPKINSSPASAGMVIVADGNGNADWQSVPAPLTIDPAAGNSIVAALNDPGTTRDTLNLSILTGILPITKGGTGANNAASAVVNLGAASLSTGNTFTGGNQVIQTGADSNKGLIVKANSTNQGVNLQEWQNSTGTALAAITATGVITGNGSGLSNLSGNAIDLVPVIHGGTGLTTLTTNALILGNGTATPNFVTGTTGSVLIGVTNGPPLFSANPTLTSITATGNVDAGAFIGDGAGLTNLDASQLLNGTVALARLSGITGAQLAAGANIAGTQLAANAGIVGTQLSPTANIAGTQLAAGANILGTQLAANANIVGTQLSPTANIANGQLQNSSTTINTTVGSGIQGGGALPLGGALTLSLRDTGVTPGSYARANITVDSQGRLSLASNGAAANLASGSDVTGILPIANGGTGTNQVGAADTVLKVNSAGNGLIYEQILDKNVAIIAGIQGTKVVPNFGNQNVVTTGSVTGSTLFGNGAGITNLSASNITGIVQVPNGGTGQSSLAANGVLLGNGASGINAVVGSSGSVLLGNTGASPSFGQITDAQVAGGAAISGTKIDPNFGTQNIVTTGNITGANITATGVFTGSGAGLTNVTASNFVGPGSTSNAVDLQTAEVAGILPVTNGGTGVASLSGNGLVLGNGTSPVTTIAAGAAGTILAGTGGSPAFTATPSVGSLTASGAITAASFTGSGAGLTNLPAANLTGTVGVANGGTGATTAAAARTNLGAAASGPNGDITSLTGLTVALSIPQGGTGANTPSGALTNLGGAALNSSNTFSTGGHTINNSAAGQIGLTVNGAAGQGVNVQEWRVNNSLVASVSQTGRFTGDGSGLTGVVASGGAALNTPNTFTTGAQTFLTGAAANNGIIVRGSAGQGAALQQWQDNNGVVLASISGSGVISGNGSGLTNVSAGALTGLLPVSGGGTGAGTAAAARTNLDVPGLSTPNVFTTGNQLFNTGGSANVGVTVRGAAVQASNLQEWQDNNGVVLASVNNAGSFSGNGAALTALNASSLTTGTVPLARLSGITNTEIAAGAAIDGSKVVPNFGAQDVSGNNFTATGVFTGNGSGLSALNASNVTTGTLGIANGGTGSTTAAGALANLGGASLTLANSFTQGQSIATNNVAQTGILVNAIAGQTANLQEWQVAGATQASLSAAGVFSGNGSGLTSLSAANITTGSLAVANGGTGGTDAASARANLAAAQSGANNDITALNALATAITVAQGGTGATTAAGARTNLSAAQSGVNADISSLTATTTITSPAGLAVTAAVDNNITLTTSGTGLVATNRTIRGSVAGVVAPPPNTGVIDVTNATAVVLENYTLATAITALNGAVAGQVVVLVSRSNSAAITVADAGAFLLSGGFGFTDADTLTLIFDGASWHEIARSGN